MRTATLSHPSWFLLVSLASACGGSSSGNGTAAAPAGGGPAAVLQVQAPAGKPTEGLIPRAVFFGNPDRSAVQISPDGKMLSWLAAVNGVMNVLGFGVHRSWPR